MRLYFDAETNDPDFSTPLSPGDIHTVHCIALGEAEGEIELYHGEDVAIAWNILQEADEVVAHNGIMFDRPALEDYFGEALRPYLDDTLVKSRTLYPDLLAQDVLRKNKHLGGSHSLEAWGKRLGCHKGDYKGGWEEYSEEMGAYCIQDVEVLRRLDKVLSSKDAPFGLEVEFAKDLQRLMSVGVCFDEEEGERLARVFRDRQDELLGIVRKRWPDYEYIRYTPVKKTPRPMVWSFDPGKTKQLKEVLFAMGWEPTEFTDPTKTCPKGNPKIGEEQLMDFARHLPDWDKEAVSAVAEFRLLKNRLGLVENGPSSYLKCSHGGRIRGTVMHIGTKTHRCSHTKPNLGNPTSLRKPWGKEIRGLMGASEGYQLVGQDIKSLEACMMAHDLIEYDGGEYEKIVQTGSIHDQNVETLSRIVGRAVSRDDAKTFYYAFMYGAGPDKVAAILKITEREANRLLKRYREELTGLGDLTESLEKFLKDNGMAYESRGQLKVRMGAALLALDGRRLCLDSGHKILNTRFQGNGAVVMKKYTVLMNQRLRDHYGLQHSYRVSPTEVALMDYAMVLHVHDEAQLECLPEHVGKIQEAGEWAIQEAGRVLGVRTKLGVDTNIGLKWSETH